MFGNNVNIFLLCVTLHIEYVVQIRDVIHDFSEIPSIHSKI